VTTAPLILASGSRSRAQLLRNAGIAFDAIVPEVDESAVKTTLKASGLSASACADRLAEAKARAVALSHPNRVVIGADQMLECAGRWFDKPATLAAAADHLRALSGRSHELPTAVVAVRGATRLWGHVSVPRLTVRPLSGPAIAQYLARTGEAVLGSVGAYQLEGHGATLFTAIEGDFFTILGLPLLPLLAFLRAEGIVES
jgi:septum formation protein